MNLSVEKTQLAPSVKNDPRWASVVACDPKADGAFYYSVKTTGVYCRPSCGAHLARPENVQFHATCKDAERAGFRPCKRCKPDLLSSSRDGGARANIRFAVGECSLGLILVAKSERGVCAILLGDDPDALACDLQTRFPRAKLVGGACELEDVVEKVVGFVEAPATGLDLPLDVRGTAFQQRVWRALQAIPTGSTVSYTDVAKRIGLPKAVRAVGQACGTNLLAVAIPCHRVVRSDGGLSGYRWGIERKRTLLAREARA